jgi:cytochrome c553
MIMIIMRMRMMTIIIIIIIITTTTTIISIRTIHRKPEAVNSQLLNPATAVCVRCHGTCHTPHAHASPALTTSCADKRCAP